MDKLISVIVPVYNVERYLAKCIDSIINQTYSNIEIILVDDGSTDGSPAICDKYANIFVNISVIHKSNGGLSSARNAGLAVAKGEYIGFVDSDDYISSDMYETLSKYLTDPTTAFVSCGIELIKGEGVNDISNITYYEPKGIEKIHASEYYEWFVGSIAILPLHNVWNKIFRANFIANTRFLEGRNNEDCQFMYQLAVPIIAGDFNFILIPDKLYKYQIRKGSICLDRHKPLFVDEIKNINSFVQDPTFKDRPAYEKLKDKYTWMLSKSVRQTIIDDTFYKSFYKDILPYLRAWPLKQFTKQYSGIGKLKYIATILMMKNIPSAYRFISKLAKRL